MGKKMQMWAWALILAVFIAGCGNGAPPPRADGGATSGDTPPPVSAPMDSSSEEVQTVEVDTMDLLFSPDEITVTRGAPVKILMRNRGALVHDLHINDLGVHSDLVRPGQSVSVTFTPTQLGRFHIHCAVPGHEAAGMYGTLHVIEE